MKPVLGGLVLAVLLAGCGHAPSEPPVAQPVLTREVLITREVPAPAPLAALEADRPQAAPCSQLVRPPPAYPDRDAALRDAPGIYEQVQLLLAGRRMRIERERELEQVLRQCAQAP